MMCVIHTTTSGGLDFFLAVAAAFTFNNSWVLFVIAVSRFFLSMRASDRIWETSVTLTKVLRLFILSFFLL